MIGRRDFTLSAAAFALAGGGCVSVGPASARPDDKVAKEVRRQIERGFFTCACCGNQSGRTWTIGNRRPGSGDGLAVAASSLFEVASVSKVFAASVAAILHCRGILDIDAPFTRYIPSHAAGKDCKITLRDIASHSAGFSDSWFYRDWHGAGRFREPGRFKDGVLAQLPSKSGPRCRYACHNMILLGYAIEHASGMDLDAAARRYLWEPLGMDSTTWHEIPGDGRTVQVYTGGAVPLGMKGDEKALTSGSPIGNAGVFTCLDDMMKYAGDLLERRMFPREYYELMFTPSVVDGFFRRSFGWDMSAGSAPPMWSEESISHSGYTGQYVAIDPLRRKFAVVLTNASSSDPKVRREAYRSRVALAGIVA